MVSYTEIFDSFVPANTGWQDYDIFTNNGIPKGAIVEILMTNGTTNAGRDIGVRTDGSALDRYITIHESEDDGENGYNALVKVDASTGLIEIYCSATTGVTFYILGYFEGVDYTELFALLPASTPQQNWNEIDLTGYGVANNSVVQILMPCNQINWYNDMGVREVGSALVRYIRTHECEPSPYSAYTNYVKANAEAKIEYYNRYIYYVDPGDPTEFFVLGYFGSGMDYQELWSLKDITVDATWQEFDLTAELDEDGRVVNVCIFNTETSSENTIGVRGGDSVLNRYYLEHEAESYGITGSCFTARSNSSGIIDLYSSDNVNETAYLAGYFIFTEVVVVSKPQFGNLPLKMEVEGMI